MSDFGEDGRPDKDAVVAQDDAELRRVLDTYAA
jgi:hypothetical protein